MEFNKIMKTAWQFAAVLIGFAVISVLPGFCAPAKKVAVIPFFINSSQDLGFLQNGLFDMLSSRLSDPGKVDVLDREAIDKAVAEAKKSGQIKGSLNESRARAMGAGMGVDYILFGSLTNFGESISLDARMVDITGKKPTLTFFKQSNAMGDVIPMVNTFAGDINLKVFNRSIDNEMYARPKPQGPQSPGALMNADGQAGGGYGTGFVNLQQTGQKGFQTHLKFDGQINALAAGDLNKDGMVQVVAATDYEILIYKLDGIRLLVDKKLEFNSTNRIIALDIADINKNGYPEIFVTSLNIQRESLQSFVLEYSGTTYVTLTDKESYYFRVIDDPDKGKTLLGQKFTGHPYRGNIYTMSTSGNRYASDRKLKMPRSVSVLSLAKGGVTSKDAKEYVLINEHGRLNIVDAMGKVDWEGNRKIGGTSHYLLLPREDTDASYQERVYFNSRIQPYDIGDDGKLDVVIVQNQELGGGALGRYKRFTKGNIEILSWNGIALAPVFKTQSVQGWISDFAIADIDGDGGNELVVVTVSKSNLFTSTTSNIISFQLQ